MKTLFMLLAVVMVLNLQVTQVHAIPLGTLIDTSGEILQGDKRFTNFEISNIVVNNPAGTVVRPTDPRDIDIQGITNVIGEHGLRLLGPFQATSFPTGSLADFHFFLEYDVSVIGPQFLIHDLRHAFSFTSIGSGIVRLHSQAGFAPDDVNALIQSVEGSIDENGVVDLDEAFLKDVSSQHMIHAFSLRAETTNSGGVPVLGNINVSSIDLTFSQTAIPEPSTWLLLGTGIAALALWKKLT
jgi:hypothetical protein